MHDKVIGWLELAVDYLDNKSEDYGRDFVAFKITFYRSFQQGKILSTRFGADFFHEVLTRVKTNSPIVPEKGQILAEYDKNFNDLLKTLWQNT